MSNQLLILRHAKSDWYSNFKQDFDRPLNKRGNKDAKNIGQWMNKQCLLPDTILCSPALRAKKTLEHVTDSFNNIEFQIDYPEALYLADLSTLLEAIQSIPGNTSRLMLVGHNPGLEELLCYLSKSSMPLTSNGKLLTTANLAILNLADVRKLTKNCAELENLIRPSEL